MSVVLDRPVTKDIDGEQLTVEEILVKYNKLVHKIANKLKRRAAFFRVEYEDVISEGNIGLLKAYWNFDSNLGYKFMTYAYPLVQGYALRFIRDFSHGPKIKREIKDWSNKVDLETTKEEIVTLLNVSPEVAKEIWECKRCYTASFDETFRSDEGNEERTLHNFSIQEADYSSVFVLDFLEFVKAENQSLHLVLTSMMKGKTQREIGRDLGVSQVHVSRKLKQIKKLYHSFEDGDRVETTYPYK